MSRREDRSMLIVLLDCSRSMRGAFPGEAASGDRAPAGRRKGDAARQVLPGVRDECESWRAGGIFGFAGRVAELAQEDILDGVALQLRIEAMGLGAGTDVSAALAVAASTPRSERAQASRKIILISDGVLD